jgi:hypothetical protein
MRYAVIRDGEVFTVTEADEETATREGWIPCDESVARGDLWDGQAFSKSVPPLPIPESIDPRQFRQSLTHFGFRTDVESAVSSMDQDTKDWYAFAQSFDRHHPMVLSVAQQIGYTPDQMDQVWSYGASI